MPFLGNRRRRWLGVILLALTLGMIIAGQTFLAKALNGTTFILYWLACFVLTFVVMVLALLELRSVNFQARQERRELLQVTLDDLEQEALCARRRHKGHGKSR